VLKAHDAEVRQKEISEERVEQLESDLRQALSSAGHLPSRAPEVPDEDELGAALAAERARSARLETDLEACRLRQESLACCLEEVEAAREDSASGESEAREEVERMAAEIALMREARSEQHAAQREIDHKVEALAELVLERDRQLREYGHRETAAAAAAAAEAGRNSSPDRGVEVEGYCEETALRQVSL